MYLKNLKKESQEVCMYARMHNGTLPSLYGKSFPPKNNNKKLLFLSIKLNFESMYLTHRRADVCMYVSQDITLLPIAQASKQAKNRKTFTCIYQFALLPNERKKWRKFD